MKSNLYHLVGIVLVVVLYVSNSHMVWAQSVADRKVDYQRDLDIYRQEYDQFVVKKAAFIQFGTFAAEEDLVKISQQVLLARSDVWIAYWNLLNSKFDVLTIETAPLKSNWQKQFNAEIDWLMKHKASITSSTTRKELILEAAALNNKSNALGALAYAANGDLTISSILQTNKALIAFSNGLLERVKQQQLTDNEKEIKLRGLTINIERLNNITHQLETLRSGYEANSGYSSQDGFTNITDDIYPIYTDLSAQYQVTLELSSGVEW